MSDHTVELRATWQAHVDQDTRPLEGVLQRHRERHRRYHGIAHVAWVLRHVAELAAEEPVDDLDAIIAAGFYHDAIYEPRSPANERASARLARSELAALGWDDARTKRVAAMIEGTATHADPVDVDTAVLFDADLGTFAADPAGYQEYAWGVRAEYGFVDDGAWRTGRSEVLQAFLDRPSIYATPTARKRWEHRARANLTSELASLG